MAILAKLREWAAAALASAGGIMLTLLIIAGVVLIIPFAYLYGMLRGRAGGRIVEHATGEIKRVREMEEKENAEAIRDRLLRGD